MKIVGKMEMVGKEVGGTVDIDYDLEMSTKTPYEIKGHMIINGVRIDVNATNASIMSGYLEIHGKKIPVGLSQFINPA